MTHAVRWLVAASGALLGFAPDTALEDTEELLACAFDLGNAHPPGYPVQAMVFRLAALLPAGSPAFRASLVNAAAHALAAAVAGAIAARLVRRAGASGLAADGAGFAATVFAAFAPTSLWSATMPEKDPLFTAAFAASAVMMWRAAEDRSARALQLAAGAAGLALACHLMGLYLLPALLWTAWRVRGRRAIALAGLLLVLPVSVRGLYAPVRSAGGARIDWGVADGAGRQLRYQTMRGFADRFYSRGEAGLAARRAVSHTAATLWVEVWPALVPAAFAVPALWRVAPVALVGGALLVVANVTFAAPAGGAQMTSRFWMPAAWVVAILGACGCVASGGWLERRSAPGTRPGALAAGLAAVLALTQLGRGAGASWQGSRYAGPDHRRNLLAALPPDAVVVAHEEAWLAPLWLARAFDRDWRGLALVTRSHLNPLHPERRRLERDLGPPAARLSAFEDAPVALRAVAEVMKPRPVFAALPALPLPSRGLGWRGPWLVAAPRWEGDGWTAAEVQPRPWRRLRWRGLLAPATARERMLAGVYAMELVLRAEGLLEAQRPGDALDAARLAARLRPYGGPPQDMIGRALAALGRPADAGKAWKRAVELEAGRAPEAWLGLAGLARMARDGGAEIAALRSAALAVPGPADPRIAQADAAVARFDGAGAARLLIPAVADALARKGLEESGRERFRTAAGLWRRALQLDPGCAAAKNGLGELAFAEERFADAERLFGEACRLSPSAGCAEGEARAKSSGRWLGLIEGVDRIQPRVLTNPAALCDVGNALWHAGRPRAAEARYRGAIAIDPGFVRAWGNLGSALAEQGQVDAAVAAYESALDRDPKYAEAMVNLAAIHVGTGNREGARTWLRRALEVRPGDPRATAMLRELGG